MTDERTVYEVWAKEANQEVIDAGYTFVSDGTWYAKGTEAVLLFNISGGNNGADPALQTVEDYIESGDTNYSGLFGGWCEKDPKHSGNADNVSYSDGWDEEGCGYSEFNIYKGGVLVRRATRMSEEDWDKGKAVKEYATFEKLK
jgi:hypothetical protein